MLWLVQLENEIREIRKRNPHRRAQERPMAKWGLMDTGWSFYLRWQLSHSNRVRCLNHKAYYPCSSSHSDKVISLNSLTVDGRVK